MEHKCRVLDDVQEVPVTRPNRFPEQGAVILPLMRASIVKGTSKFCEPNPSLSVTQLRNEDDVHTPFELIGHALVDEFPLYRPLGAFDPSRGRNQRSPMFLLCANGGSGILLLQPQAV